MSSRGKGKVLRGADAAAVVVRQEQPLHQPRYPGFLAAAPVKALDAPAQAAAAAGGRVATETILSYRACQPFVARGSALDTGALEKSLSQALQLAPPSAAVDLLSSAGPWGRLIRPHPQANLDPSSPYHVKRPESKLLPGVAARDIPALMSSWTTNKVLAQLDLCQIQIQGQAQPGVAPGPGASREWLEARPPAALHASPCQGALGQVLWSPEVEASMSPICSWLHTHLHGPAMELTQTTRLLSQLSTAAGSTPSTGPSAACGAEEQQQPLGRIAVQLECCSCGSLLPLKYETTDRLVVQLAGQRHVLLMPPDCALGGGLAPFPCAHPYDTYSAPGMASTACAAADPRLAQHVVGLWPGFEKVRGLTCTLSPGELLFIPRYWSAHVEMLPMHAGVTCATQAAGAACSQPTPCMALVLQISPAARGGGGGGGGFQLPSPAGLRLQASRIIETWVAAQLGPLHVRSFLIQLSKLLHRHAALRAALAGTAPTPAAGGEAAPASPLPDMLKATLAGWWQQGSPNTLLASPGDGAVGHCALQLLAQDVLDALACCCRAAGPSRDSQDTAALLVSICDGRLLRTPWLDQYCRPDAHVPEPLRLSYRYPPAEMSAEEAAFPELFTAVIQEKEDHAAQQARRQHHQELQALLAAPVTHAPDVLVLKDS